MEVPKDHQNRHISKAGPTPILCVDFDGVIHSYTSGWQGADVITDPPVDGALKFLLDASEHFTVAIYSSRSGQPGGIEAMRGWLAAYMTKMVADHDQVRRIINDVIRWPTEKPSAMVTLDDRALTFTGVFPDMTQLLEFQPWTKRPAVPADIQAAARAIWDREAADCSKDCRWGNVAACWCQEQAIEIATIAVAAADKARSA